MSRGKQIQKSAEKTERTCRSKKKKERGWKEPEDQWKNNSLWRFLHENPDLRSHHHSSGELWCVFWWVRACFMNTVVQLNIPLSRHSYVLDQCYHYSSMITKIWSDCPFKVLGREARFKPRHRGKAVIVPPSINFFYKQHMQQEGYRADSDTAEVSLSNTLNP